MRKQKDQLEAAKCSKLAMRTRCKVIALLLFFGLLAPWPGPHIDAYLPLAAAAIGAANEGADAAFWLLWCALWLGASLVCWTLLTVLRAAFRP